MAKKLFRGEMERGFENHRSGFWDDETEVGGEERIKVALGDTAKTPPPPLTKKGELA